MKQNQQSAGWMLAIAGMLATALSQPAAGQNTPPPPPAPAVGNPQPVGPQNQPAAAPQPDQGQPQGQEALTRGPMHEAFAEATPLNPEPGIIVPKAPPEPINEVPPEEAPASGDYVWIPGYWGWDDDRQDFLWISGVWRVPTPGAEWVPGYWTQVQNGYQWITGYWYYRENPQVQQVNYLPTPPENVDAGPSTPTPGADFFWVPGNWVWQDTRYLWQAGYWARGNPDWVWIPARYMWTPAGCVFIAGHWDYPLANRGVLFAPMYFDRVVYTRPQFQYIPTVIINTAVIETTLFVRPRYCHYYFGDYYAANYRNIGIVPWYSLYADRRGYDPLFVYQYWRYGHHDRQWLTRLEETYTYRERNREARPPHTFREFARWEGEHRQGQEPFRLAARVSEASQLQNLPFRLERISTEQRNQISQMRQQVTQFSQERMRAERDVHQRAGQQGGQRNQAFQASLPRSPISQGITQHQGREARQQQGLSEAGRPGQRAGGLPEVPKGPPQAAPGSAGPGNLSERGPERNARPGQAGDRQGPQQDQRSAGRTDRGPGQSLQQSTQSDMDRQRGQQGQGAGQPGQPSQAGQPFGSSQERRAGRQPLEGTTPSSPQGFQAPGQSNRGGPQGDNRGRSGPAGDTGPGRSPGQPMDRGGSRSPDVGTQGPSQGTRSDSFRGPGRESSGPDGAGRGSLQSPGAQGPGQGPSTYRGLDGNAPGSRSPGAGLQSPGATPRSDFFRGPGAGTGAGTTGRGSLESPGAQGPGQGGAYRGSEGTAPGARSPGAGLPSPGATPRSDSFRGPGADTGPGITGRGSLQSPGAQGPGQGGALRGLDGAGAGTRSLDTNRGLPADAGRRTGPMGPDSGARDGLGRPGAAGGASRGTRDSRTPDSEDRDSRGRDGK